MRLNTPWNPETTYSRLLRDSDTQCAMAIMGQDFPAGFNYFILGDSFMRRFYYYFDKNNNRVGFINVEKLTYA